MKNKAGVILLFVLFGLGLPISLIFGFMLVFSVISWLFDSTQRISGFGQAIQAAAALFAMTAGATYAISYSISLAETVLEKKKITFVTWLPCIHAAVTAAAVAVWYLTNKFFG